MDSISTNPQSMDLPPVVVGQPPSPENPVVKSQGTERNTELLPQAQTSQQVAPVGDNSPATQANPVVSTKDQQVSATKVAQDDADTTTLIADDVDVIEKEWVDKAKAIVGKNKGDPYEQNKELNKFKATYIKKRYNRDVKLTEE